MKDTWASGAIELFKHADLHIKLESAFDKRIAFISIDNSVETAIRTFISLPQEKSGVRFPPKEVDDAVNSFPKLVALVFKYASERVSGLDNGDIEHYHRVRNQLYHNGTGLSVDERYLKSYRQIACILLQNLFGIETETPVTEVSLEKLIYIWNQIELALRKKLLPAGIDHKHTFKWEQAARVGILDLDLASKIAELRLIRNNQVHSTSDKIDMERIKYGVVLGENILKKLED
jgi:hypothetical protein